MDKVKSIFASRTILTNFMTFLSSVGVLWGLNLGPEQQAYAVTAIVTVGGILSSYFRTAATQRVALDPGGSVQCNPLAVALALLVALSLGACAELKAASGIYGAANARIAETAPELYRYCVELQILTAAIDGATSERHQGAIDRASAVLGTVCAVQPASVPAAIATALAAYRAVKALPPPAART